MDDCIAGEYQLKDRQKNIVIGTIDSTEVNLCFAILHTSSNNYAVKKMTRQERQKINSTRVMITPRKFFAK